MITPTSGTTAAPVPTRFAGAVVVVAGGTGALGAAVAQAFLDEGATVVIPQREQGDVSARPRAAEASRRVARSVDLASDDSVRKFFAELLAQHGRLDGVVNAVGGYVGGSSLWETDTAVLDRMFAANLRTGYTLFRAAIPALLKQGRGALVNVAAKAGLDHPAGAAAYAASKAGAIAMTDSLAADLLGTGVRINSILPSIIDTAANRAAMPKANYAKWPKPQDIARVILFLCSDDAAVIHGAAIPVYGNG